MIKCSVKFYWFNASFLDLNLFLDFLKLLESNCIKPLAFMDVGT